MKSTRILIADDHALVRSGIRALLEAQPDFTVVGEAEDGAVALKAVELLEPDVVVMDLAMPGRGGINATEDLHQHFPRVKVVVLTMHDDEAYMRMARLAGASAFVLKKSLATELIRAIRTVQSGGTAFPAAELPPANRTAAPLLDLITIREREVLSLIALGFTTAEISSKLHISEKTVETHRAHITEKLALRHRADLVRFALEQGLMKP